MANQTWLRLYTEITRDRKLRRLPVSHRWIWITVLCIAKESPKPGVLLLSDNVHVTLHDVADEACVTIEDVESAFQSFIKQEMLSINNEIYFIINWGKRQFLSDSSTERVRKYRERKRECNVSETPPDTDTDTDIYTTTTAHTCAHEDVSEETILDDDFKRVIKHFENNVHPPTSTETDKIKDWLNEIEADVIIMAVDEAVLQSVRKMSYINQILMAWHTAGIKTRAQVEAHKRDWQDKQKERTKKASGARDKPLKNQLHSGRNVDLSKFYDNLNHDGGG